MDFIPIEVRFTASWLGEAFVLLFAVALASHSGMRLFFKEVGKQKRILATAVLMLSSLVSVTVGVHLAFLLATILESGH